MKFYALAVASAALFLVTVKPATAAFIVSPTAVTGNTMGTAVGGGSTTNLINNSGLPAFTSGVTDYDTYLGTNPVHAAFNATNAWASNAGVTTGQLDFDLGASYSISGVSLWNQGNLQSVNGFTIFTDDNVAFSSPTNVGSFNAASSLSASSFLFGPVTDRYVRLQINSNYGSSTFTTLGEIAFRADAAAVTVPAPSSLALMLVGGIGFAGARRRLAARRTA